MFINTSFPFIKSFRHQFLIGVILGIFISFLVIFLEPMGANNYSNPYKNLYFTGYGVIVFLCYLFYSSLSIMYFHFFNIWKWLEEIFFFLLFISTAIVITFFYTELYINKSTERIHLDWFLWWYKNMFISFGVLTGVLMIMLRRYYGLRNSSKKDIVPHNNQIEKSDTITIKGSLKKDVFTCEKSDILYVKSEENYVIIHYVTSEGIKSKMLRCTLKHIHEQLPDLFKIHRSFIVHPIHIQELKGNAQNGKVYLHKIENPLSVSKTYYTKLKNLLNPQ